MRSALLVIDVQQALFDGVKRPFEADDVVERINQLSGAARQQNIPVIMIQHEKADTILAKGSEGWHLQSALMVNDSDYMVAKSTPDSFLNTTLLDTLQENDVDHLIIGGYASEFCIDTTVRSAAAHGYPVTLVSDAHTTHDKTHATAAQIRAHENATLPSITSFGPKIVATTTAELLAKPL